MKLLFVASEAFPLIKTGGLADVAGSLPEVLRQNGADVRLLLPAYADLLTNLSEPPAVAAEIALPDTPVRVLETRLPDTALVTWLVDHPSFSERPGNPYHDEHGTPWPDNADRFLLLSRVTARIAAGDGVPGWRPDVLHCNDWHTGPAIALLRGEPDRPRTVFTIHNLAHMGIFDQATFDRLPLSRDLWPALEFYDQCSFIKGGLAFADSITTVSPGYAREICESPGGMGLEGLLRDRSDRLVGILNGIQDDVWDPSRDTHLEHCYDSGNLEGKTLNKTALQRQLALDFTSDRPLLGFVGRLVEQKGLEIMLPVLEEVLASPAQLVFLGRGEAMYEEALQALAARHTGDMALVLAYDEALAHCIEASADVFLMPSLFEPCGLNQLYSLRYGTPPVVRNVGGLADTVVHATKKNLQSGKATGFVFHEPEPHAFLDAVQQAVALWSDRDAWQSLQRSGMEEDFSWRQSASRYLDLYRSLTPALQ